MNPVDSRSADLIFSLKTWTYHQFHSNYTERNVFQLSCHRHVSSCLDRPPIIRLSLFHLDKIFYKQINQQVNNQPTNSPSISMAKHIVTPAQGYESDNDDSYGNSLYANRQQWMTPSKAPSPPTRRNSTGMNRHKKKNTRAVSPMDASMPTDSDPTTTRRRRRSTMTRPDKLIVKTLHALFHSTDNDLSERANDSYCRHYAEEEESPRRPNRMRQFLWRQKQEDAFLSYMIQHGMDLED